jgi:hypothetical protein
VKLVIHIGWDLLLYQALDIVELLAFFRTAE